MSIRATDRHNEKVIKCPAVGTPPNADVGVCPPSVALLAASRAAGALAPPLSKRYFLFFDPALHREIQRRSIGFRLLVRIPLD